MGKFLALAAIILMIMVASCGEKKAKPDPDVVRLSDKEAAIAIGADIKGFHKRFSEYKWVFRLDKNWDEIYYSDSKPKVEMSSGSAGSLVCMEGVVIFQPTFHVESREDNSNATLYPKGHCVGTANHQYHIYEQN